MFIDINIILLTSYILIVIVSSALFWSVKRANPVFWFIILQSIISLGTLWAIDLRQNTDVLYASLFFLALLGFLVGAFFQHIVLDIKGKSRAFFKKPIKDDASVTKFIIWVFFLISIYVVYLYYQAIGYNLFLDLALGKPITDFKSLRLDTYSGDTYYAPGYVNQLKNALLPLTCGYLLFWLYHKDKKLILLIIAIPMLLMLLYSLLGTGQRAPLVYALVGFFFSISLLTNIKIQKTFIPFLALVPFFGLFSLANERITDFTVLETVFEIMKRIFINEQTEGILSFQYITTIDHAYFYEWLEGFLGILPNHPGSNLEHQAFYNLHGTYRGTSSVSTVASAYHNGGLFFVPIFYSILGVIYTTIYSRFLKGSRTILRSFGYGYIFFILSVYIGGAPVVLLNKGMLAFILILVVRKVRYNNFSSKQYSSDPIRT